MELLITPSPPAGEFNFNGACTSPHPITSSPASPQPFGSHMFNLCNNGPSSMPPPSSPPPLPQDFPPGNIVPDDDYTEFAFDFSVELSTPSLPFADELFLGGKIKPLKLIIPSSQHHTTRTDSQKSPRSPKRMLSRDSHSFLTKAKEHKSINPTRLFPWSDFNMISEQIDILENSSNLRKKSTGFSRNPLTVSNMVSESNNILTQNSKEIMSSSFSSFSTSRSSSSSSSSSIWCRKWKLTDLLLFRTTTEGVSTDDDNALLRKNHKEDVKNSSFRSSNSSFRSEDGNSSGSRRKKGRVSAHEWHYRTNRAAAEEMKRKTFLPYKKNLLGCMDLDPGVREFSRGIGVR